MLALSLFPPAKVVVVGGKVAVKGVNAAAKAGLKFGLSSFAKNLPTFNTLKNVLNAKKVIEVFDGIYKKVIKAPLAATELWLDRTVRQIADFRLPEVCKQLATATGPMPPKTVGEAFGEAKDLFVKMASEVADNRSVWKDVKGLDKHIDGLLKKSTCSIDELTDYLKKIDEYKGTNFAEEFVSFGKWPDDIQIPKDSRVLNEDYSINWSEVPNGGYVLDKKGNAIKEEFKPKQGDIIDRYGPPNGRYTSPVMEGRPYDYVQRSLPYVEDATKYHQYEVIGDFSRLKEYVMNCDNMEIKLKVEAQIERYYNGDYSKVIPHKGVIAKGFGSPGGGIQYELPLPVEWLEGLGMLKEIK